MIGPHFRRTGHHDRWSTGCLIDLLVCPQMVCQAPQRRARVWWQGPPSKTGPGWPTLRTCPWGRIPLTRRRGARRFTQPGDATTSGSGWDDESGVVGFHLTAATQSFERSSSCPATRLAGGQLAVPERPRPVRLGPWRSPACAQCARCDLYKAGSAAQNLPLRCPRAAASRVPAVGPAAARLRHQPTSRGPFARCGL